MTRLVYYLNLHFTEEEKALAFTDVSSLESKFTEVKNSNGDTRLDGSEHIHDCTDKNLGILL